MYKNVFRAALFTSVAVLTCGASAQQSTPIAIPTFDGNIEVDGVVDEAAWQQATVIQLEYVTRPFENSKPPVDTLVRVIENGDTLFVSFVAQDPDPQDISAFYRDRDKVWNDDLVGVKLDTFNDSRLAYQFFVNPFGIQGDAIENEMTGRESDSWDAIWQSAGRFTEQGFEVEMAIPLQVLNFAEGEQNKIWGAEFVRFYPRKDNYRISNRPVDRNNSCDLCQLGEISGFDGAQQSKNLALIPTLVLGRGRSRDPSETLDWEYSDKQEIGLDVKWGITPEVSLQATLNPDFSQVESDVAQLSINNTFALFFDEKRPFFLENADYFSSNYNLVYTRNIASPDFGAKVTGRVGDHTMGVFVANDESTTFLVPGNLGSSIAEIEDESVNLALRYRFDVSDKLSLGALSTVRDTSDYHNYLVGVDGKYQITEQDTLRVQLVASETQYPNDLFEEFTDDDSETAQRLNKDDAFTDSGYRINYRHDERDWFFRLDRFSNGEDLRADLGFVSRADRTSDIIGAGYRWYSEDSWWNKISLVSDWDIHHNDDGELIEKESQVWFRVDGKWQSFFEFTFTDRDRVGLRRDQTNLAIDGNTTLFGETQYSVFFEIQPTTSLYFNTFVRTGDNIDFANNRLGEQLVIEPELDWNIGKHANLEVRHTYRDFEVDGEPLFTANLTDMRFTYQFDQRQFLRLILVYSDIERNQDNYTFDVDSRSRSLGSQLLYSYKVNPLTKFFIGYSDSAFKDDVVTTMRTEEESVFMKVSYAWLN